MAGKKEIPNWAKKYFSISDLDDLEKTVQKQEERTSGEIVPMIVRSTVATPYAFLIFFMTLAISGLVICDGIKLHVISDFRITFDAIILFCSAVIAFVLCRIDRVRLLTVHSGEIDRQVHLRATIEFFGKGLHQTKAGTGVLIFLSLMEKRAVVLADKGIASKLDSNIWKTVISSLTHAAKDGNLKLGLEEAIHLCGKLLAEHFPPGRQNENEISDRLILKD